MTRRDLKPDTQLAHLGRDPEAFGGAVNPPVYHVSTTLRRSLDDYESTGQRRLNKGEFIYGRYGTPTSFALEEAMAALEGGYGTIVTSSGLAAVACALLAYAEAGAHFLVADSVYLPTRRFCKGLLARVGVETEFYDPMIGTDIADLLRPETRVVYLESPGSLTFEVQDVPAIAQATGKAGAAVLLDNTWATPLYFKPFDMGVDVSIQAGTKYIVGHSDAMLGLITTTKAAYNRVRETVYTLGNAPGPDDVYLGLRGLRSLAVRLRRHEASALTLMQWLKGRPEVARILHPAMPEHPGHKVWKRDFQGACGLFGIVLARPYPRTAIAAMIEGLELFGIGASWGGYESLIIPAHPERFRSATTWDAPGPTLRLNVGLEDPGDLIADLEAGFERLNQDAAATASGK